jgi:GNAT superfamily N-acetyltransferase
MRIGPEAPVPDEVRTLLEALPAWFGIPEANEEYVDAARRMETWTAREDDALVGVVLLERHFDHAAEVHLMAVRPERRGQGIGRAVLDAIEESERARGTRLLEVKTLGPSRPNPEYDETRHFYRAVGFLELEETDLWGETNPCLIMVKPL